MISGLEIGYVAHVVSRIESARSWGCDSRDGASEMFAAALLF